MSYQYRKSHCGDMTFERWSRLHNGISYTGKMTSLYWIRALAISSIRPRLHRTLTHWGQYKMAAFAQTTFSSASLLEYKLLNYKQNITEICSLGSNQSGTKPNLVAKIWPPSSVTIFAWLPMLVLSFTTWLTQGSLLVLLLNGYQ